MSERLFDSFPDDLSGGEPLNQEQKDSEFLSAQAFAGMTKEKFEKLFRSPNRIAADVEYFRIKATPSSFDVDETDIFEDEHADRQSLVASIKNEIYRNFKGFFEQNKFNENASPDFTWQGLWNTLNHLLPSSRYIDENQKKGIFLNVAEEMERDFWALSKTEETASE
jgi:hypothetical protein